MTDAYLHKLHRPINVIRYLTVRANRGPTASDDRRPQVAYPADDLLMSELYKQRAPGNYSPARH